MLAPVEGREDHQRWLATSARFVSHGVLWVTILVPVVIELAHGWHPLGDDAAIAIRSFQVLSHNSPLLGLYSKASRSVAAPLYDLGPAPYWILAIPVSLDHAHGLLWGSALVCGAVLSLTVEALWRTRVRAGVLLVAFLVVDLAWRAPGVLINPEWNAYFGLVFLVASVALAWAVAEGSLNWWPLLVLTGSVAAQSHLVFAAPALLLVVASPVIRFVVDRSRTGLRWAVGGGVVGIVVWALPVWQQLADHPGNMTQLLHADNGLPTVGARFGLQSLAWASSPFPIWARSVPGDLGYPGAHSTASMIQSHSALAGVAVLALLVVVALLAYRRGRTGLFSLSAVTLVLGVGLVVSFSAFPSDAELQNLDYLVDSWWILGTLLWVVAGWAVVEVVTWELDRRRAVVAPAMSASMASILLSDSPQPVPREMQAPPPSRSAEGSARRVSGPLWALGLLAVAVIGIVGWTQVASPPGLARTDQDEVATVQRYFQSQVPRGPVAIEAVGPQLIDAAGIAWQLIGSGWSPGYSGGLATQTTGLYRPVSRGWPTVVLTSDSTAVENCLLHGTDCGSQVSIHRVP